MYKFLDVNGCSVDELINKYDFVACKVRNSRIHCIDVAVKEVLFLLRKLDPVYLPNGPMSDVKGVFIVLLPKENYFDADIFNRVGYCEEFYKLVFNNNKTMSTWKKHQFSIEDIVIQSKEVYIDEGADRRTFRIIGQDGEIKDIIGYRGDGTETGRRALPVEDCRVLLNLSMPSRGYTILDPFAGGGGIIYQAKKLGLQVFSNDIDPTVAPGLISYGSTHTTNDIRDLYFDEQLDMISTEVPFSPNVTDIVCEGLINVSTYLKDGGMVSIMCADHQSEQIKKAMKSAKMKLCGENNIDRKGTPVTILNYTNSYEQYCEIQKLNKTLETLRFRGQSKEYELC